MQKAFLLLYEMTDMVIGKKGWLIVMISTSLCTNTGSHVMLYGAITLSESTLENLRLLVY